jgi:hypothetical protein
LDAPLMLEVLIALVLVCALFTAVALHWLAENDRLREEARRAERHLRLVEDGAEGDPTGRHLRLVEGAEGDPVG